MGIIPHAWSFKHKYMCIEPTRWAYHIHWTFPLAFSVSALKNGGRTLELESLLGGMGLEINAQMKFKKMKKLKMKIMDLK